MDAAFATSRQTSAQSASFWSLKNRAVRARDFLQPIHTLHLYGAVGITAFGWTLSRVLGFDCVRLAPLWFAGALLVYNFDRLKFDPADAMNTPQRLARHSRLRKTSIALAVGAAVFLVVFPLLTDDWLLLALTIGAGVVSLSYSFPLLGFRCKDVPVVKTLFAPTLVALAYFVPPMLRHELRMNAAAPAAWVWIFLTFNMMLCDLRDLEGDRRIGTKSLPVLLGRRGTALLLWTMIAVLAIIAFLNGWQMFALITSAYLVSLLIALRKARAESFYEWFAEGMLLLPPMVWLISGAF